MHFRPSVKLSYNRHCPSNIQAPPHVINSCGTKWKRKTKNKFMNNTESKQKKIDFSQSNRKTKINTDIKNKPRYRRTRRNIIIIIISRAHPTWSTDGRRTRGWNTHTRTGGRADERQVLPAGFRGDLNVRIQRDRVTLGFVWRPARTIFDWVFGIFDSIECVPGRVQKFGAQRQQKILSCIGQGKVIYKVYLLSDQMHPSYQ